MTSRIGKRGLDRPASAVGGDGGAGDVARSWGGEERDDRRSPRAVKRGASASFLGPAAVFDRVSRDLHVCPCLARYELKRRGLRLRADDAADDAFGVAAVLRAVRGVNLVLYVVRLDEKNVLVDTAGSDVSKQPRRARERGGAG